MRRILAYILSLLLLNPSAHAELLGQDDQRPASHTSEYVFRSTSRGNLIPIQVMGSVTKPGLYFVPPNTNLVKLLTLAGGPQSVADNEEILVRKADRSWDGLKLGGIEKDKQSYRVDLEKMLRQSDHTRLPMSPNDVVFVPPKQSWISQDATRTISVVSLLMGIVLTGILIDQKSN